MNLWYNRFGFGRHSGQAALEYVLSLAGLLVVIGILMLLVGSDEHRGVIVRQTNRAERLVASDCP